MIYKMDELTRKQMRDRHNEQINKTDGQTRWLNTNIHTGGRTYKGLHRQTKKNRGNITIHWFTLNAVECLNCPICVSFIRPTFYRGWQVMMLVRDSSLLTRHSYPTAHFVHVPIHFAIRWSRKRRTLCNRTHVLIHIRYISSLLNDVPTLFPFCHS